VLTKIVYYLTYCTELTGLIWLIIQTGGRLLWTR